MDEKSIRGLLSQLIPDSIENSLGLGSTRPGEPDSRLVESLKALAGQAGGSLEPALNEFLGGRGELHAATRTAAVRGGASGTAQIAKLLKTRFNLAPAIANLIAPLLVKLLPAVGQIASGDTTAKPKPRPKPRPSSSTKPKPSSSAKPKKNPSEKAAKKESASTARPKTAKRTISLEE